MTVSNQHSRLNVALQYAREIYANTEDPDYVVGQGGARIVAREFIGLFEQLETAQSGEQHAHARIAELETTLAHAEAFIEHQDMSYRWAEWCEGRDPNPASAPAGLEPVDGAGAEDSSPASEPEEDA